MEQSTGRSAELARVETRVEMCDTDDELVEHAVGDIGRIWSGGLLSTVVALGDYLIEKFYGGSLDEACSRRPHKPAALARLMERASELPVSVHALKQSVRIASQHRALPRALADGLSKSQHEALLPVADPTRKMELAGEAVAQHLSSREIAQRANALRTRRGGGRPPSPPVVRRVGALVRLLDAPELDEELVPSALSELEPTQVEQLREQVRRARSVLARVDEALEGSPRRSLVHEEAPAVAASANLGEPEPALPPLPAGEAAGPVLLPSSEAPRSPMPCSGSAPSSQRSRGSSPRSRGGPPIGTA
jgi:hypothetical protein